MSNFRMTWHVEAATMRRARHQVMVPRETLPKPLGDRGIPSLPDRAKRAAAHRRLVASLRRLGTGEDEAVAA